MPASSRGMIEKALADIVRYLVILVALGAGRVEVLLRRTTLVMPIGLVAGELDPHLRSVVQPGRVGHTGPSVLAGYWVGTQRDGATGEDFEPVGSVGRGFPQPIRFPCSLFYPSSGRRALCSRTA